MNYCAVFVDKPNKSCFFHNTDIQNAGESNQYSYWFDHTMKIQLKFKATETKSRWSLWQRRQKFNLILYLIQFFFSHPSIHGVFKSNCITLNGKKLFKVTVLCQEHGIFNRKMLKLISEKKFFFFAFVDSFIIIFEVEWFLYVDTCSTSLSYNWRPIILLLNTIANYYY